MPTEPAFVTKREVEEWIALPDKWNTIPLNDLIASTVTTATPCPELDLCALQQQFRAASIPAHISISGCEFRILGEASQLNSILDDDAFNEQDIAEMKALPLRVFNAN